VTEHSLLMPKIIEYKTFKTSKIVEFNNSITVSLPVNGILVQNLKVNQVEFLTFIYQP